MDLLEAAPAFVQASQGLMWVTQGMDLGGVLKISFQDYFLLININPFHECFNIRNSLGGVCPCDLLPNN